ncbi:hypothetical protein [Pontimicrobium sp. IMCC45349]|uniref:hypothetical protein n=1 Tax=Pontimicrobium sp. IMCC45349 TaxID=3391574 RepID=UPI0039A196C0
MKYFLFIVFSLSFTNFYCQSIYVPYRVGDKFGMSDEQGNLVLEPQFDIINFATLFSFDKSKNETYYVGHKILNDSTNLSSFIINDKIILKDKDFNTYYYNNEMIEGKRYTYSKVKDYWGDHYVDTSVLFTNEGHPIFDEEYIWFMTLTPIRDYDTSNEILIASATMDDKFTLSLYDKKLKKITKTYFKKSSHFAHKFSELNYNGLTIIYKDEKGQAHKLFFVYDKDKNIILQSDKLITLKEDKYADNNTNYDYSLQAVEEVETKNKYAINKNDSISLTIPRIDIKGYSYKLSRKIETLTYDTKELDRSFAYVYIKDGKLGIKRDRDKSITLEAKYDELYYASFSLFTGYILKKDNKYGLYAYLYKDHIFIEPKFDMIPLLARKNFRKKGFHLLKLFDSEGKLFCYANQDGLIYYQEK